MVRREDLCEGGNAVAVRNAMCEEWSGVDVGGSGGVGLTL